MNCLLLYSGRPLNFGLIPRGTDQSPAKNTVDLDAYSPHRELLQIIPPKSTIKGSDSIVVAKFFAHMLSLANLAKEVQIAYRRRNMQIRRLSTPRNS
ncbi:hypothetical protein ACFX2F_046355 [Malus domestica]